MFTKNTPTFESAMKTFTQAQAELKAAGEANDAKLAEVRQAVADAEHEKGNIDRVVSFFDNLLGAAK